MTHNILTKLGWSPFYADQITADETGTAVPVRVTDIHRNAVGVVGKDISMRVSLPLEVVEIGVTVGDWLLITREDHSAIRVLDRQTLLKRRDARTTYGDQLIAANVDTLFVVSSCNKDFNVARLERYFALAYQGGVEPVLILTKADLCDDPNLYITQAKQELPGVTVEVLDALDSETPERLSPWCKEGQTVALLGTSGVGKTTLTNALTGLDQLTKDIRSSDARGRHTTTARSMHPMQAGGWLIDTPGMRALRLSDAREGVETVFSDIAELAQGCRFNDCAHETEPGCAVQAALAAGDISQDRFKRWQKLVAEDANSTETPAELREKRKQSAKLGKADKAKSKAKRSDSA